MVRKDNKPRSREETERPHRRKKLRLSIGQQDLPYLPLFNDSPKDNQSNSES